MQLVTLQSTENPLEFAIVNPHVTHSPTHTETVRMRFIYRFYMKCTIVTGNFAEQ